MCYYVYGFIDENVDSKDFRQACERYEVFVNYCQSFMSFPQFEKKNCYLMAAGPCHCDTALGRGDTSQKQELENFLGFLKAAKQCRKIKSFLMAKIWDGRNSALAGKGRIPMETIHVDDVDIKYLADMNADTLYKFQMFKRYSYDKIKSR